MRDLPKLLTEIEQTPASAIYYNEMQVRQVIALERIADSLQSIEHWIDRAFYEGDLHVYTHEVKR